MNGFSTSLLLELPRLSVAVNENTALSTAFSVPEAVVNDLPLLLAFWLLRVAPLIAAAPVVIYALLKYFTMVFSSPVRARVIALVSLIVGLIVGLAFVMVRV